jgi:hypothetical protein
MIAGYEIGNSTVATPGSASAAVELRAPTRRLKVRETGLFSQAATAVRFAIGRPAAVGVTPSTQSTAQPQDPADAAGTGISVISWGTAPTVPATFLRQADFNNVVGSGMIWTWPSDGELIVPTSGTISIVYWFITAGPTCDFYFVLSE